MAKLLVVLAFAWPLLLAGGVWAHAHDGPRWLTAAAYLSASRVCHQKPERSFTTAGVQWPVCGRCSGLYLAAPLGAVAALGARRRTGRRAIAWFAVAAAPTAVVWAVEILHIAPVSSVVRAVAALPLGFAVALLIVGVTRPPRAIG